MEDVATVQTGLALGPNHVSDPVELPYLRVANVQDGHFDLREIKTVRVERTRVDRYRIQTGDVLLTEGGDFDKLGRGHIWRGEIPDCLHQNHIFVVRTNAELIMPELLAAIASGPYGRAYFLSCSKQSTNLASINSTQLKDMPLPVPPRCEQDAIVRVLRDFDDAVNRTDDLIDASGVRLRGLMQQLLTGRRRLPAFADQLWEEVHIGDLLREVERYVEWSDDECYRLVSIRRRSGGFFDREQKFGRDILTKTLKATRADDFVLARMQILHGAMTVTPPEFDGAHVSDSYLTFVPSDEDTLHMPFFGWLSKTKLMYHKAYTSSYGVALEKMTFYLPWWLKERVYIPRSIDEQRVIADVLDTAQREIDLLKHLRDQIQRQKRGLMQKLLTGEILVPGAKKEETQRELG
ncbi:MAG: restriction endonuclease subunit S [Phycisphaerales bacterium]|nr:restriction endonuclease subunit S [Phycisphaerales bacterium]